MGQRRAEFSGGLWKEEGEGLITYRFDSHCRLNNADTSKVHSGGNGYISLSVNDASCVCVCE